MLHIKNHDVKKCILERNFGLEKESLRIKKDGTLSHSLHPFTDDTHIVKDFCENQTEINTSVHTSAKEAVEELEFHNRRIYEKLESLQKENTCGLFLIRLILRMNLTFRLPFLRELKCLKLHTENICLQNTDGIK